VGSQHAPIVVEVVDDETELLDPEPGHHSPPPGPSASAEDDIVDAEIVD
jgi:hypothetical protein